MSLLDLMSNTKLWAMEQSRAEAMFSVLPSRLRAIPCAGDIPEEYAVAEKRKLRRVSGKVAVMPIHGVIEQRLSWFSYMMGGCGTEDCAAALSDHLASKDVQAIVLHVDSPGGTVYGVEELSDMIYEARQVKPIYAVSDSLMASAAYWVGTAAERVFVTPGGDVGSVGVYAMHVDYSAVLEAEGIKVTIAKAGKYKAEMNPYEPLTEEARDYLQESVDETYTKFIKAVARNRGLTAKEVRENFGQGRVVSAEKAKSVGMVDRVATFPKVMQELLGSSGSEAARAASVEILRLRHEAQKRRDQLARTA